MHGTAVENKLKHIYFIFWWPCISV